VVLGGLWCGFVGVVVFVVVDVVCYVFEFVIFGFVDFL